jgi:type VI secretion system protein ImpK
MYIDIANLVHPIVDYGLSLRTRLEAGAPLNLSDEQTALKTLLLTERQAQRWPEYAGSDGPTLGAEARSFLGIRYALACWLDELFIRYSPWADAWSQHTLEEALYGTTDGSRQFWRQASAAQARASADSLEVFYLCVMLGFRGEFAEAPEKLRGWISETKAQLATGQATSRQPPSDMEPATHVPPLKGRQKLSRLILLGGVTLLVIIPLVVFIAARGY